MNFEAQVPRPNAALDVAGWGDSFEGENMTSALPLAVTVNYVTNEDCNEVPFTVEEFQEDTMICAYEDEKDACQGDSGEAIFEFVHQLLWTLTALHLTVTDLIIFLSLRWPSCVGQIFW